MKAPIIYKGFNIKKRFDHNTETTVFVGISQGLRLTASTVTELKQEIDSRVQLRAEIKRMEFKTIGRKGVAFNDYSTLHVDTHEVNRLVRRAAGGEVFHAI